jgi:hypothetical protein
MSHPNNGTNHRTGIANEHQMTALLGTSFATKLFPILEGKKFTSVHRGGTTYKEDAAVLIEDSTEDILVSFKKKEKTNTGTFDWINSGKILKELETTNVVSPEVFLPLSNLKKKAFLIKEKGANKSDRDNLKKDESGASNAVLNSIATNHNAIKHLVLCMAESNKYMNVLVTTKDNGMLYHFHFTKHSINTHLADPSARFFLSGDAKQSRTIMIETSTDNPSEKKQINTGIRVRLHLNNSVSPLLGISKSGQKNSSWVIKFQQDDFQEIKKIATTYQL